MKTYRYIFWDLDGTIINSFEGVSKCLRYAFSSCGYEVPEDDVLRKFIGPPFRYSFPLYANIAEDQMEPVIEKYRERYNTVGVFECELFSGVRESMEAFQKAGLVQVLASSKPEAQCRDILNKFALTSFFDEIVGATPDGRIDSKIQVLNEAFRRLGENHVAFSMEDVVLLGDTKFDANGAKEAGIDCIGVSYGFGTVEDLKESGVVAVFDDQKTLRESIIKAQ